MSTVQGIATLLIVLAVYTIMIRVLMEVMNFIGKVLGINDFINNLLDRSSKA